MKDIDSWGCKELDASSVPYLGEDRAPLVPYFADNGQAAALNALLCGARVAILLRKGPSPSMALKGVSQTRYEKEGCPLPDVVVP